MMNRTWPAAAYASILLSAGAAETPQPALDLIRPAGARAYELTVSEEGIQTTRTRTRFVLHTAASGEEWVEVMAAWQQRDGAEEAFILDAECRNAFDGDAERLGRVRLVLKEMDLTTLAPSCVPEPLFGALTDMLTFLLIQAPSHHGIEKLRAQGDVAELAGFTTTWSRKPQLAAARFISTGGWSRLTAVANDRATVRWSPGLATLNLLRVIGPGQRVFLTGSERLELELQIDTRTGELLEGRSIVDDLTLTMHMNVAGDELPEAGHSPAGRGMPVPMKRTLALTRIR